MIAVASGPSPTCVTPARVMLYLLPAFKFSRWYLVSEAGMLSHANSTPPKKSRGKKDKQFRYYSLEIYVSQCQLVFPFAELRSS